MKRTEKQHACVKRMRRLRRWLTDGKLAVTDVLGWSKTPVTLGVAWCGWLTGPAGCIGGADIADIELRPISRDTVQRFTGLQSWASRNELATWSNVTYSHLLTYTLPFCLFIAPASNDEPARCNFLDYYSKTVSHRK